MHDGSVVVRDQVERVDLSELWAVGRVDVVPVDLDRVVAVASHLLVPHAESVQDLVHRDAELQHTRQVTNKCLK